MAPLFFYYKPQVFGVAILDGVFYESEGVTPLGWLKPTVATTETLKLACGVLYFVWVVTGKVW